MADFRFDDTKNFTENCDDFLATLETVDAEMASILRGNWDILVAVVSEGERDSKARTEFNTAIATALDALAMPNAKKEGA
jgi:hypothetical protein